MGYYSPTGAWPVLVGLSPLSSLPALACCVLSLTGVFACVSLGYCCVAAFAGILPMLVRLCSETAYRGSGLR